MARRSPDDNKADGGAASQGGFVGHALLVGLLTLVSRMLGLVRDAVLAACFGMSAITDAFWIGFVVPNLFRRLFGEGALTAAFIPVYTRELHRDPVAARRLASLCVASLLIGLGVVTVLGEALLGALIAHGGWSADSALALRLTAIMLPYMPMVCAVALLGGVLQVHRRFGPAAAAPIILNVTMIAASIAAAAWVGDEAQLRDAIGWVAVSVIAAGVLQLAWLLVTAWGVSPATSSVREALPALRAVLWAMVPMALGLAVFQINTLLDSLIAWTLSPKQGGPAELELFGEQIAYPIQSGAVTGLQFAQRLYQFPLGVFGIAIATAIFPALTRTAASRSTDLEVTGQVQSDAFASILRQGLRLTVFVGLPASVGLILVRIPLARVIFERRQFTLDDSLRVATILAGYASAVWAYSMTHVLTRAFYAVDDTRSPLRASLVMMLANFVLNLVLVWSLGAAALAWSTAACAVGQVVILMRMVGRYVPQPIDASVRRGWLQSAGLTGAMACVLVPVGWLFESTGESSLGTVVELATLVSVGIGVVLVGAKLMGAEELKWLLKRGGEAPA